MNKLIARKGIMTIVYLWLFALLLVSKILFMVALVVIILITIELQSFNTNKGKK